MLAGFAALALYAATACIVLAAAGRWIRPLRFSTSLFLAAAPLLLTGKALVTAGVYAPLDILYDFDPLSTRRAALGIGPDRTPALADVVTLDLPWREAARASLRRGELPYWNPYVLAGDPLLAMQQPAVLHPATLIGLVLPLPQAWSFEATARLLLALVCGFVFFAELGGNDAAGLFGGLAWALSDYFLFFLGFPHALAVAPFPLLTLGLRRLARGPTRSGGALTLTALLLTILAGHPETLLHGVAGAGLYFLFELSGKDRPGRGTAVALAVGAGALALGLSAVLLLPLARIEPLTHEHLIRTLYYAHEKRSLAWALVRERLQAEIAPYTLGVSGHGQTAASPEVPTFYAGSLLFPLAVTGLLRGRRSRLFFAALAGAALLVCVKTPAADLLARLPLFDIAINEYTIFLATFSLVALSVLGLTRLRDDASGSARTAFLGAAAVTVLVLVSAFWRSAPRLASLHMPASYARSRLLLQLAPPILAAALVASRRPIRREIAAAGFLVLLVGQRILEAGGTTRTMPADAFYPPLPVLGAIPRGQPYRFAATGMTLIPNTTTLYGLEDVRGYEAMRLFRLVQTFGLWSVDQGSWFNRVDDPDRPFLSFLNVRWVLTPRTAPVPPGWPIRAEGDGMRLVENPRALERVFVPRTFRGDASGDRRIALLGGIVDFREQGIVEEDTGGTWRPNGRAEAAVESYGPRRLAVTIRAAEAALVGTSLVDWPGWEVSVDGHTTAVESYNHAFVGFRVPPGDHRVIVAYTPAGLRAGAAVSAASLLLLLLGRRRRR